MVTNLNQNRQLYVVKGFANGTDTHVDETSSVGTIEVKDLDDELFFVYKGADTVLKSDRIPFKNITFAKSVNASTMATGMKKVELTLASAINSGAPVSGQDYVLRINLRQFYGMSDEDQYFKDAAVHATASMSASDFYKAMVNALNLAFSREVGATPTSNPYLSFSVDNASTATKIIIEEKPQDWTLGTQAQERVLFDVVPTTIYAGGDDVIWGTVTEVTPTTTINNGKKIADLEYFCMGERGDQYRMQGWPNYIPTTYLVDPTAAYHTLEIHFAFTDEGVNSYRSEKDITLVAANADKAALNSVISAINSATGLTIATIS